MPDPGSGGSTGRDETVSSVVDSGAAAEEVEMVGKGSVEKEEDW
jgi:hypothetical protein